MNNISGEAPDTDIKALYVWLEVHAIDFKYSQEIGDKLQKLRDKLGQAGDLDAVKEAQWEIDAFNFVTKNGQLVSLFAGTDDKGDPFEYPTFDRFTDDAYNYFSMRQTETLNPVLKARYSHLLWQSPKKNQIYAQAAIEAYVQLIPLYAGKDAEFPNGHFGQNVIGSAQNAFILSLEANLNTSVPKTKIFQLLSNFNSKSNSWFRLQDDLIELVLEHKGACDQTELARIPGICGDTAQTLASGGDLHGAITIWELGMKSDAMLHLHSYDWNKMIAEAYEMLMQNRDNNSNAAIHFCEQALIYYRKVKNNKKVQELEKKREKYAKTIQFQSVSTRVELTEHIKWCKDIAAEIAKGTIDEIMATLAGDKNLLPDIGDVNRLAKESLQKSPIRALARETMMDKRGHVVQHAVTPEEKERAETVKMYDFYMRMDKLHLINEIIFAAFSANKLTYDTVCKFLREHSWLGKRYQLEIGIGHAGQYTWMDLLEPGLKAYFEALQIYHEGQEKPPELILTIDSLTSKIEGLLRDLCRFRGAVTTFDRPYKGGRMVTYEKYIDALLREPVIEDLLNPSDLLFLKYLLVEQIGFNLRNEVAHCLIGFDDYDLARAHLVFLALIRISPISVKFG